MVRVVISFLLFIFLNNRIQGQSTLDEFDAKSLNSLAWELRNTDFDSAFALAQKAQQAGESHGDLKQIARSYRCMGLVSKNRGEFEKALRFYRKSLAINNKIRGWKEVGALFSNLGYVFEQMGSLDSASHFYDKSISLRRDIEDSTGLAYALNNQGRILELRGDFNGALKLYLEGLLIREQNGQGIMYSHMSIGNLNYRFGNIENALNEYKNAFVFLKNSSDLIEFSHCQNNIGICYMDMEMFDSAEFFFNQSILLKEEIGFHQGLLLTFNNLGILSERKGDFPRAVEWYQRCIKVARKMVNMEGLARALNNLGYSYFKMNKLSRAIRRYDESLKISRELNLQDLMQLTLENMSLAYKEYGDLDKAYKYLREFKNISDDVYNQTKSQQIAELQTKYETERKEKEIVQQKVQIQQAKGQRNNLVAALLISLVLAGISIFFYTQRGRMMKLTAKNKEVLHDQEVSKLLKDQELKSLDAMIEGQEKERKRVAEDLHDRLGATLSATKMHIEAVEEQIEQKQVIHINKLIDKAIEDTRQISHNMLSGVLTKFGLMAALRDLKETIEATDR
ncbi:MAG: tetratricopeptide repeat protein, partial [Cyclobacteriaceae bacterium]|nr:tetratricopeptide repeat protein [Cyclobacteriaceae bacterium HetDA_MAG_MS6]